MSGFVYLLSDGSTRYYKIGITERLVEKRISELSTPKVLTCIGKTQAAEPQKLEKSLHFQYSHHRVNKEWFELAPTEVRDVLATFALNQRHFEENLKSTCTKRNYFRKLPRPRRSAKDVGPQNDSPNIQRKRFQRGSVFQNSTKTIWRGSYCVYFINDQGKEVRRKKQISLCPVTGTDGRPVGKKAALALFQPYVQKANQSMFCPEVSAKEAISFDAFVSIWKRDFLLLYKPATQSGMSNHVSLLSRTFGRQNMREIGGRDIQEIIASNVRKGNAPKTVRNMWTTISLIWRAAHQYGYVDSLMIKPRLPRGPKTKPSFFTLPEVGSILASCDGSVRTMLWLFSETGIRSGELAGLRISDVQKGSIEINQSVWCGRVQSPKTTNSVRKIAISSQLENLLKVQIEAQKKKGFEYLFSSSKGTPLDMSILRSGKTKNRTRQRTGTLHDILTRLSIAPTGWHAFRHFNVSLMDSLRTPLKTIQERIGHALTGNFTLDVYGHALGWAANKQAAEALGEKISEYVQKMDKDSNVTTT